MTYAKHFLVEDAVVVPVRLFDFSLANGHVADDGLLPLLQYMNGGTIADVLILQRQIVVQYFAAINKFCIGAKTKRVS